MINPLIRSKAFMNNIWVPAQAGGTFDVINPATGAVIGAVPDMGVQDTDTAIAAAYTALPKWRAMLAKERGKIIRKWSELIEKNAEDLARLMTMEQGKPLTEARSEIKSAVAVTEYFAEEGRRVFGEYGIPHKADARMLVSREPVGVVAAITPWNFPVSMITRKLAPALAAGCTIVVKPAEDTPLCALALADMALAAGFPEGVINIITCSGTSVPAVGQKLCSDLRVRKISLTGSTEVGRILLRQGADTVKRFSMELGGNAPFIIFDSADIEKAADAVMISKFRNAGQTCICANRIFVHDKIYDQMAAALEKRIKAIKVGPGDQDGVTMGPLINRDAISKVQSHVDDACTIGGSVVTGGKIGHDTLPFYTPTLITGGDDRMLIAREETFGPVAALFRFKDETDVIARANNSIYGLAAYVYTQDMGQTFRVSEGLEYGMIGINEPLLSSELVPVGGVKQSGFGREGGHWAIEDYLNIKYTLIGGV